MGTKDQRDADSRKQFEEWAARWPWYCKEVRDNWDFPVYNERTYTAWIAWKERDERAQSSRAAVPIDDVVERVASRAELMWLLEASLACFNAADAEGLQDRLHDIPENERDIGSLHDLITRRLAYAPEHIRAAIAAMPVEAAKVEKPEIDVCPQCGSGDVSFCEISVRPNCNECGHWGAVNHGTRQQAIDKWNKRDVTDKNVGEIPTVSKTEMVERYERVRRLCLMAGNLHPEDKSVCHQALSSPAARGFGESISHELALLLDDAMLALSEAKAEGRKDALNPRLWTREMSAAWHKSLPDTQAAFDAIRALATPAS